MQKTSQNDSQNAALAKARAWCGKMEVVHKNMLLRRAFKLGDVEFLHR